MRQPQDRDADHGQHTGRPPDYVIPLWVNQELGARIQRLGPGLLNILQAARDKEAERDGDPQPPDLEAEP